MTDLWLELYLRFWGYPHYMCSYGGSAVCRLHRLKAWFTGDDQRWWDNEDAWNARQDARIRKLEQHERGYHADCARTREALAAYRPEL